VTDGFTYPPQQGVLRIFFAVKNPTASTGFEPANLGTKGYNTYRDYQNKHYNIDQKDEGT